MAGPFSAFPRSDLRKHSFAGQRNQRVVPRETAARNLMLCLLNVWILVSHPPPLSHSSALPPSGLASDFRTSQHLSDLDPIGFSLPSACRDVCLVSLSLVWRLLQAKGSSTQHLLWWPQTSDCPLSLGYFMTAVCLP